MIKVYGQEGCAPCATVKRTLENRGVEFEYIDIRNTTLSLDEAKLVYAYGKTPIVVTDTESWSGFDVEKMNSIR